MFQRNKLRMRLGEGLPALRHPLGRLRGVRRRGEGGQRGQHGDLQVAAPRLTSGPCAWGGNGTKQTRFGLFQG